jgi:hypothetical protein
MKTTTIAMLLLFSIPFGIATAGQVYKCKGPNGEITFTNVACPTKTASVEHYGSFQPVPDSPDQVAAAAREADRIHEQQMLDQLSTDNAGKESQPEPVGDASADRRRAQAILDEHKRWRGTRLDEHPELDVAAEHHHSSRAGSRRGTIVQNCNTAPGGAMTCFGSDGSIANGQVTPGGNATMFGNDGSIQQLHGISGSQSTFCDPNGFCN